MAYRVLIGDRHGTMGMWISRPGHNVFDAGENDMLFVASNSLNTRSFQTVQQGSFGLWTDNAVDIAFPYLGILPIIFCWTDQYFHSAVDVGEEGIPINYLELAFPGPAVARFTARQAYANQAPAWSVFRYLVINQSLY